MFSSVFCLSESVAAALDAQHPRQIDPIIFSTFASSRSMAGSVPSSGPFIGPLPTPDDESAVPSELVPGAAALVREWSTMLNGNQSDFADFKKQVNAAYGVSQ